MLVLIGFQPFDGVNEYGVLCPFVACKAVGAATIRTLAGKVQTEIELPSPERKRWQHSCRVSIDRFKFSKWGNAAIVAKRSPMAKRLILITLLFLTTEIVKADSIWNYSSQLLDGADYHGGNPGPDCDCYLTGTVMEDSSFNVVSYSFTDGKSTLTNLNSTATSTLLMRRANITRPHSWSGM